MNDKDVIHVYVPTHYFIGQTRCYGCRSWVSLGRKFKTSHQAMAAAVMNMGDDYYRARVLMVYADGYSESVVVMECKK